jgi:hypothetical protein
MEENTITYFAETDARNKRTPFGIMKDDRSRHMYIIGKTGMGKSTVMENMAIQDIQNGEGLAFIDPHGKTADLLLDYIPQERMKDVLYFAPFDLDHPVSFNVMEDVGYEKRHLVSSGLMSAFKKIWVDAWSARMEYILNNTLLALLEYPDATLISVNRMLSDKEYRKKVVDNITDVSVKAFWTDEFAKYGDRYMQEAGAAIQNKIGQFISNPLVRNIIGQPKSTFDIRTIMDEKKILIINLSKGRVGEANANLLGSMLITKIYLAAMSRADASPGMLRTLPNFFVYVDEFQSFANESFADILSEARKYKLNLTIAHQYVEQMSEEVTAAVFGNVGTMVVFRVGAIDSEIFEKEFFPTFTKEDVVNLDRYQMYLKLMINGVSSTPFSATGLPPIEKPAVNFKEDIIRYSRQNYAKPRAEIEEAIRKWHEPVVRADIKRAPEQSKNPELAALSRFPKPSQRMPPSAAKSEAREAAPQKAAVQEQSAVRDQPRNALPDQKPPERREDRKEEKTYQQPQPAAAGNQIKRNNPKAPTPENLSALREALASVVKNASQAIEKKVEEMPAARPAEKPVQNTPPKAAEKKEEPQAAAQPSPYGAPSPAEASSEPLEVPEEILRRIFDIDK